MGWEKALSTTSGFARSYSARTALFPALVMGLLSLAAWLGGREGLSVGLAALSGVQLGFAAGRMANSESETDIG
jgi:hypothetical protein